MKISLLLICTDLAILIIGGIIGYSLRIWYRRRYPGTPPPDFQSVVLGKKKIDCGNHSHEYPFIYISVGDTSAEAHAGLLETLQNDKEFTPEKFTQLGRRPK